ncbi:hypothetical protein BLJAPNOD_06742 [Ensifer sp. M14]|nr:hypothetical protein BLJAPNOD_06742 [Ensifer sp. M14]
MPRPPREEAEPTLSPRPMRMPVFSLRRRLHPRANFCWQSQMLDPLFRRRPREKTRVKRRKCRIRRTSCSTRDGPARVPLPKRLDYPKIPPTFFRSPARLYGCQGSGLIGSNEEQPTMSTARIATSRRCERTASIPVFAGATVPAIAKAHGWTADTIDVVFWPATSTAPRRTIGRPGASWVCEIPSAGRTRARSHDTSCSRLQI